MNLLGYTYKISNSGYNTERVNKQCNAGYPLETSGGLYRGPPAMLIYVNTKKDVNVKHEIRCNDLLQEMSSCYSNPRSVSSVSSIGFGM